MRAFDKIPGLAPGDDQTRQLWPATREKIKRLGLTLDTHGSLRKSKVQEREGATGIALKATEITTKRAVAIKVYKDPNAHTVLERTGKSVPMMDLFHNERAMLSRLDDCPYVPKYYYSVDHEQKLGDAPIQPFHVMSWIDGHPIDEFVKDNLGGGEDVESRIELFRQVLAAANAIHTEFGLLHRDFACRNVLVDRQRKIHIIYFGAATPIDDQTRLQWTVPAQENNEPEELKKVRRNQTDDVRNICDTGYQMFTGEAPDRKTESQQDWSRKLAQSGTPDWFSDILVKGMRTRNPKLDNDSQVWNTASDIDSAIESHYHNIKASQLRRARNRQFLRNTILGGLCVILVAVVCYFAWNQIQDQGYITEITRLRE